MSERGMLAFQSTRNKKWRGRSPDILFSLTPSTFGGMSERSEDNPCNNRKTKIYLLCREWSERSEDNPLIIPSQNGEGEARTFYFP
jgi:hypothetical protein